MGCTKRVGLFHSDRSKLQKAGTTTHNRRRASKASLPALTKDTKKQVSYAHGPEDCSPESPSFPVADAWTGSGVVTSQDWSTGLFQGLRWVPAFAPRDLAHPHLPLPLCHGPVRRCFLRSPILPAGLGRRHIHPLPVFGPKMFPHEVCLGRGRLPGAPLGPAKAHGLVHTRLVAMIDVFTLKCL